MAELDVLAGEIVSWAGHLAAGTARWLGLIARFDTLEGFARWECQSTAQWLNWQCGLDLRSAREHVRVARRLEELPLIRETFGRGELSSSKVRAITRVATVDSEGDLVMLATHGTAAHVEKPTALRRVSEHTALEAAEVVYGGREVTWHHDDDGTLILHARLSPEDGAVVRRAIDLALHTRPEPDRVEHRARSADALVSVAGAYLDGMAHSSAQERYQVVVHVDADVLTGVDMDDGHGRCHLDDGPTIAAETARRVACDTTVVKVFDGPDGPVAGGRRTRTIPAALRRLLHARDQGRCQWVGCENRRTHLHHIKHWAQGGPTEAENLVTLCSFHHRRVHEGHWSVQRHRDNTTTFTSADGWTTPTEQVALLGSAKHLHKALTPTVTPNAITSRWAGEPLDLDHICNALTNTTSGVS